MTCLIIAHSQSHPCHSKRLGRGQHVTTLQLRLVTCNPLHDAVAPAPMRTHVKKRQILIIWPSLNANILSTITFHTILPIL